VARATGVCVPFVKGNLGNVGLREKNPAGGFGGKRGRRISRGYMVDKQRWATSGLKARRIDAVLDGKRHSVKRTEVVPVHDRCVSGASLLLGVRVQGNDGVQLWVQGDDPITMRTHDVDRRDLLRPDRPREFR